MEPFQQSYFTKDYTVLFRGQKLGSWEDNLDDWIIKVKKLHQSFRHKTLKTCNNVCVFESDVCQARNLSQWENLLTSEKLKAVKLFSDKEFIFQWEREYLRQPALQDIKLLPDLERSRIVYLQEGRRVVRDVKNITCELNDQLVFRVDLVDGYGNPRHFGGDEVRSWVTDVTGRKSMTGHVRDMRDGSYIVTVSPAWPGVVKLNVAVVYPREYLRAALYHMREGRHRFIFGLFRRGNKEEVTICHATPNIPGRPCVCNYTSWNRRPFYCGKPLDSSDVGDISIRLDCQDWAFIRSTPGPILKDYTKAEDVMASTMSRPMENATITHELVIRVEDSGRQRSSLPSCRHLSARATWTHQSPRGFWVDGVWNSLICKEPALTPFRVQSCLKSTNIWFIGDSNLYKIDMILQQYAKYSYRSKMKSHVKIKWAKEMIGQNVAKNITVSFRGHEHPLFHYIAERFTDLLKQGGVEDFLVKIPSEGSQIVLIHYYLHLATSHLSAIFERFVAIRDAILKLLKRNPDVLVVLRGPHISSVEWETNHLFGGDVQASFISSILDDVFENVKDKVVLLDGWDMTISWRNTKMHPFKGVAMAMLRTLLAFRCS